MAISNPRVDKLNALLVEQPNDSFLLFALALEYIKMNDDATAKQHFLQIQQLDKNYHAVYYHLGKLYEREGSPELAITTYEQGIEVCKTLKEQHQLNELQGALDLLLY